MRTSNTGAAEITLKTLQDEKHSKMVMSGLRDSYLRLNLNIMEKEFCVEENCIHLNADAFRI